MYKRRLVAWAAIAAAQLAIFVAPANATDQSVRVSSYCTQHFARAERQYGIPKHLMMAISATESGRWNKEAGLPLPWPWTINVEGAGHYYQTKNEAVTAVRRLMERGKRSIDVGCMQISLKHHPKAFVSISDAFEPERNVAYAARFLREKFAEERSWRRAVAAYHSKLPMRGGQYFARVKYNWRRVLAALGQGGSPYIRNADSQSMQLASIVAESEKAALADISKDTKKQYSQYTPRKSRPMKIIQVTSAPETADTRPDVLVVRPKEDGAVRPANVIVVSQNAKSDNGLVSTTRPTPSLTPTPAVEEEATPVSSRKKGPNFIFY